ncbi:MAG: hypothetical protein Q8R12_05305 [bacterium]|nr:hypothetical protein [bacterium]
MDEIEIELTPQGLRELDLWVEKLRRSAPDITIPKSLQKVLNVGKIATAEGEQAISVVSFTKDEASELYLWHIRFLVQGREFFKPESFLCLIDRIRRHR